MHVLWTVMQNELRRVFLDRSIWLNLVVIPVALVVVVGFANGGPAADVAAPRTLVDVLNLDGANPEATALLADLDATLGPGDLVCPQADDPAGACALGGATLDEAQAAQRLDDGVTVAWLTIPASFAEALRAGQPTTIIYRADDTDDVLSVRYAVVQTVARRASSSAVAGYVGAAVAVRNRLVPEGDTAAQAAFQQDVAAHAAQTLSAAPIVVDFVLGAAPVGQSGTRVATGFVQSVPGMGSMYVMFTVLAGMVTLLQEREAWTLQRLAMLPVRRWEWLGGKVGARVLLGMIQYGVVFGLGVLLGVRTPQVLALVLVMLAFTLAVTALTYLLAASVRTSGQASSLSLLLALTLAPLGGAWWPLEITPPFMQTIGLLTPVGWAMSGFSQVLVYGNGLAGVGTSVMVLLAMAAGLFALAVARLRYVV